MALLLQVMQIVAPVFILAAIGVGWVALKWEYNVAFVTRLAMTLSVPCLIFTALMRSEIDPQALRDTALAALVAYLAVAAIAYGLLRIGKFPTRTYLAPLTFGNTGNLGLPLALFAFGPQGLDFAVVVFAVMAILSFTVGVWIVSGGGSPVAAVKEPMVWATILGGMFLVNGWSLPVWATNTLDLTGQMAIPVMLITLGVAVARLHPGAFGKAVFMSLAKVVLCTIVAVVVGLQFNLPPVALGVLVLQIATPVAVTSYMLAEKYKADSDAVAGLVMASTLMSVAAIPITLAFLV